MNSPRTWVLVCDGGRARVLARPGPGAALSPVAGLTREADLPRSAELGTERPGRTHESHGNARHAYEQRSDPHDRLEAAFLAEVLDTIAVRLDKGELDRLVIVASPRALGIVRAKLPARLAGIVAAEIDKDLTKTADREVAGLIADTIRV